MPVTQPLLIAAEGPDGVGKTTTIERLARWLERSGRRVSVVAREPSPSVRAATASARGRTRLTPRVAALLEASDDVAAADRRIRPRLADGRIVLADRYAWTAVARHAARGLDPTWLGTLHAPLPRPDLVLLFRERSAVVVERALASRPRTEELAVVGDAYRAFVERLLAAYDGLAATAEDADATPWPVTVLRLDARLPREDLERRVRGAIRPIL